MKSSLRLTIAGVLLWWAMACTIAAAQQSSPANTVSAPVAGAIVSDFKGKVTIQLPGQALLAPSRGQVLPPESTVNTDDGRLLLRLSDGSDILVRPHTRLIIKEPETSSWRYLQLLIGRIRTQIQKHLGGTPPFQIGTPTAVISVRGTRFDVEVNRRGFTEVDVAEGVVELDSLNGRGGPVTVSAGFSSRVGMDSGPEVPRPTNDLRPQLERPNLREREDHESGEHDLIRELESSGRGHGERSSGSDDRSHAGSESSSPDNGTHSEPQENEHHEDEHHGGKPPDVD